MVGVSESIFGLKKLPEPVRVAFIGKQCAGKTEMAKAFVKHLSGFGSVEFIKFADPIYEALAVLQKKKDRKFMQGFGDLAQECFGKYVFVDLFEKRLGELEDLGVSSACILCDDVRRDYEFESVKRNGFLTVYVDTPDIVRMKRAEKNGLSFIENHVSEMYIAEMKELCDMCFSGESDLKDYGKICEAIHIFYNAR